MHSHESRASLLEVPTNTPVPQTAERPSPRKGFINAIRDARRKYLNLPSSKWTKAFAITSCIQTAVTLALECYVFGEYQIHIRPEASYKSHFKYKAPAKTIPTFLALYIFGFIYELVLVYDALRLRNTIQVIGLCACNVGLLIYGAVQVQQVHEAVQELEKGNLIDINLWPIAKRYLITIPVLVGVGSVAMVIIAWKLYDEFAWNIYKNISADLRMKRRYLAYQIYISLLKFDFFFFLGFTIQFLVIVNGKADAEFELTIAAIPVTIIILLSGAYFVRRESTLGMIFVLFFYFGGMAYFLFKMVRMYTPPKEDNYRPARRSLTFFAIITLVLIVLTITNACMCTHNFHKGLKPHLNRNKKAETENQMLDLSSTNGMMPPRMTID